MSEPTGSSAVERDSSADVPHSITSPRQSRQLEIATWIAGALIAVWAVLLCWNGVSWAFRAWPMLSQDELNNLGWSTRVGYGEILHLIPRAIYNDRPMGFALERFLFDRFGFDYTPQLVCFLLFHLANCAMAFVMFRRLGLRIPLAIAGLGVLGTLATTAQTATYLAASFDVLCTFFLLGSTLAILSERKPLWLLSALLYLLALRSKEFGIVIPVFLTALVAIRAEKGLAPRRIVLEIGRRLWLHCAIMLAFVARYLLLARDLQSKLPAGSDYHLDFSPAVALKSFAHYSALIFGAEEHWLGIVATLLLAMLGYAIVRRRGMILFGVGVFLLTLLPVSFLSNIRSPFYAYGPQIFLILAVALFLQDMLELTFRHNSTRWWAAVCTAVLVLAGASGLRRSQYFRDRVHFSWMVRSTTGRSAADMQRQLRGMGPSAHLFVNSGPETPWLIAYGDCIYPRMMWHSQLIECTIRKPEPELRAMYERDPYEKYFLDYAADGTLNVRLSAPAGAVPDRLLPPCDAGLVDDQSPQPEYRGTWRTLQGFGSACGKTLSYTDAEGAEVSLVFNGTGVSYVFTRAYTHGQAQVLIDGSAREGIDQFSPGIEWRSVAAYDGLAPGQHRITIRCLHSKATFSKAYDIDVDGFFVHKPGAAPR